jgi:hypothetical protein
MKKVKKPKLRKPRAKPQKSHKSKKDYKRVPKNKKDDAWHFADLWSGW